MRSGALRWLLCAGLLAGWGARGLAEEHAMTATSGALDTTLTKRLSLRYLLYLPDGYSACTMTAPGSPNASRRPPIDWHLEVRLDDPVQVEGEIETWLKAAFELAG